MHVSGRQEHQSSLLYGVSAVGDTRTGVNRIRSFVSRQLRSIAGRQAYLTKQTNTEIRQLLGIREVMATLQHEVQQMALKVSESQQSNLALLSTEYCPRDLAILCLSIRVSGWRCEMMVPR